MDFFISLLRNTSLQILCMVIVLDLIFGVLRAIKEHTVNSSIGIDGMIRKVGMLITVIILTFIDSIVHIDFIGFIPETIKTALNLKDVGIEDVFNILFVVFEILSIFKNMILCKMPIPRKLQYILEKVLQEFTGEIKESEEK